MDRVVMAAGVAWTLSAVAACGKHVPVAGPGTGASLGNVCDRKLLTAADVAPLLSEPVTRAGSIPGDAQTCRFKTAGFASVTVSLRPGLGRATLASWTAGRMPLAATALPGVGDEAVWVNDLTEVVAEKGNLLCDVQVTGLAATLDRRPLAARQKAIGTLCNTVFEEKR